jgi:hypothetical protein
MAQVDTANNPNDPNNPNNTPGNTPNQPGQSGTNQPATTGGAGAVTTTGSGNVTGQVVGTNNPTQPFQNISAYLAANAPQSATLANQVASSVSQPIQKATGDIATAGTNFSNAVTGGYVPQDTGVVSAAAANPVATANDPNALAAFQKQLNDAYTGPSDFTTDPAYAGLEAQIAAAQAGGSNAQTLPGIQSLLQGVEGPTTAGINNLDTLLLAQNPTNYKTISDAGSLATSENNALGKNLSSVTSANNAAAADAAAKASAAKTAANAAFTGTGGVVPTFQDTLNNQLQGQTVAANKYNAQIQDILQAINTGKPLTPQQAALVDPGGALSALNPYGTSGGVFPNMLAEGFAGISPDILAQFYKGPSTLPQPTLGETITPDQASTAQALNTLLGNPISGLPTMAANKPFEIPAVAGSFDDKASLQKLYDILSGYQSPYLAGMNSDQLQSYLGDYNQLASWLGIPTTTNPTPTPLPPTPPPTDGGPVLAPPGGGRGI